MDNELNTASDSVHNPQRRQVMKAAAWAVPVVAVVASAPLAAASLTNNNVTISNNSGLTPPPRPYAAGSPISGTVGAFATLENPNASYDLDKVSITYVQTDRLNYVMFTYNGNPLPTPGNTLFDGTYNWTVLINDLGEVELELNGPIAVPAATSGNPGVLVIQAPVLGYSTTMATVPNSTRPAGARGEMFITGDDRGDGPRVVNGPFGTTTY